MPSAIAQEKLAARARRIRSLRQRVVASILATFVLAWGVVAFDGSMGTTTKTIASTGTTATTTDTDSTTSTDTSSSSSSSDDGSSLTTSAS